MSEYHTPVMLDESVSALVTNLEGTYIDATFGGGGHTAGILSRLSESGKLIAFDRDSDALANAPDDKRFTLVHNNFRFVQNYVMYLGHNDGEDPVTKRVDGILADLGVSSHQFDTAERGFSFRYDAPLDMRMSRDEAMTAADVVNTYEEAALEKILRLYGEVEGSRRVAGLIVQARQDKAIKTTGDLDAAISKVVPKNAGHKFLAKVYQALRIEVNHEMKSLEKLLEGSAEVIREGGRLIVITYHSLEDRMVKNFIRYGNVEGVVNKDIYGNMHTPFKAVNRKPILPTEEEISSNTRARSAKLRIAERTEEAAR